MFGPIKGTKFVIPFENRVVEVSVSTLKEHFQLKGEHISLCPLTLSGPQVKLEPIQSLGGEDVFLLDHELYQFYKVVSCSGRSTVNSTGSKGAPILLDTDYDDVSETKNSVMDMIRCLPLQSNLFIALSQIKEVKKVQELPLFYDDYVAFELPPCRQYSGMYGMEQKYDSHLWTEYVTCSSDSFDGVVRFSRCSGHLRCINIDCSYYLRTKLNNESQWRGRLNRSSPIGLISREYGTLSCLHCGQMLECVATCPAVVYYCLPRDKQNVRRCALHLGCHKHPIAKVQRRVTVHRIGEILKEHASRDPFTTAKQLEHSTTEEIIMNRFVGEASDAEINDEEFAEFLDTITPLSNKRRIERSLEYAKRSKNITAKGLEAVLDLKHKCTYPFIHSILFPGQLANDQQPHVFKMYVKGPGSGVDLVNRMQPEGNLKDMWVHFDHVHHV